MSIPPYFPPDSLWRGCAANFPQPVEEDDVRAAQYFVETVYYFNCYIPNAPLGDIIYRSSDREQDVLRHVFRWDMTDYLRVFEEGFQARRQRNTSDLTYYNLDDYVHRGGRPLDSTRPATHAFVSTTLNSNWRPNPSEATLPPGGQIQVYRYEIYAPGGIWVAQTLGDQYGYPSQDEVCFVGGIARQYIRSAQLFIATREGRYVRWRRESEVLRVNWHFNAQSHPDRCIDIQRPIFDYIGENGTRRSLRLNIPNMPPHEPEDGRRERREVSDAAIDWYTGEVANVDTYITAAFRAYSKYEAYFFMKNEYLLLNYAPGTTNDRIINGPHYICDGFPSLSGTAFGEYGIDCAFDTDGYEAFIFSGNLCAYIDYAPGTKDDKILRGPMTITAMFPFFKRTVFENGIDAAFRSTSKNEAYLFKGDQYALINYNSKNLIAIRNITQGFYSLRGTIFESGIDAAFASHNSMEAYLFKGDQYALINFAPGTTDDYIIGGGVKKILPANWPSLVGNLPRKNRGLDEHHHDHAPADRDHDEL